jgi:hypothetical protein
VLTLRSEIKFQGEREWRNGHDDRQLKLFFSLVACFLLNRLPRGEKPNFSETKYSIVDGFNVFPAEFPFLTRSEIDLLRCAFRHIMDYQYRIKGG